jgi:copper(I)-binding protein
VIRSSRDIALPRRILIAAVAALVPLIAGCEAGVNPPSLDWHPPTDGTDISVGEITISDAFVLGAPLNQSLQPGHNAGLFLSLVNTGAPDQLMSITAPGTATTVQLPGGTVSLPSQHDVRLSGPAPKVLLEGLTRPLIGGSVVKIILTFENAPTTTLFVPVMPRAQYYSTFSPAPSPSASVTPSSTGTKVARHSVSPSPSSSP